MAFDFPASPSAGQEYTPAGGPTYVWESPRWLVKAGATAETRNRIVNGAMLVSQELLAGVDYGTNNIFIADQWAHYWVATGSSLVSGLYADGPGYNRIRTYTVTAHPTMAAGEVAILYTFIEGVRIADFGWGTASAVPAVIRLSFQSDVAGTFGLSICNSPTTYTFCKNLTVAASTLTEFVIPIPVPSGGAWATGTGTGLTIQIAMAAHSSFLAPAEGWNAGTYRGVTGMTNGLTTASTSFWLSKVGLYRDPNGTGRAPSWEMPDYAEELAACQRYWQRLRMNLLGQAVAVSNYHGATHPFPVEMRTTPALATNSDGTPSNVGTVAFDNPNTTECRAYMVSAANGIYQITGRTGAASARM